MPFLYLPGMMRSSTPLWRRIMSRKAAETTQPADIADSLTALGEALDGHGAGKRPEKSATPECVPVSVRPPAAQR
jgi:hypothetical protein